MRSILRSWTLPTTGDLPPNFRRVGSKLLAISRHSENFVPGPVVVTLQNLSHIHTFDWIGSITYVVLVVLIRGPCEGVCVDGSGYKTRQMLQGWRMSLPSRQIVRWAFPLLAVSVVSIFSGFFLWKRRASSDERSVDDVTIEREEETGKDEEVVH